MKHAHSICAFNVLIQLHPWSVDIRNKSMHVIAHSWKTMFILFTAGYWEFQSQNFYWGNEVISLCNRAKTSQWTNSRFDDTNWISAKVVTKIINTQSSLCFTFLNISLCYRKVMDKRKELYTTGDPSLYPGRALVVLVLWPHLTCFYL